MIAHIQHLTVLLLTPCAQDPQVVRIASRAAIARSSRTSSRPRAAAQESAPLGAPFGLGTTLDAPPWLPGHLLLGARPLV